MLGRANRLLSGACRRHRHIIARRVRPRAAAVFQGEDHGTPLRPAVLAAAALTYEPPEWNGPLRLIVAGGSQGARVMADIVPPAIEQLEPALWRRLRDAAGSRRGYGAGARGLRSLKIKAELAPFFTDLPARLASSHLVISRSGAGTVAELPRSAAIDPGAAARRDRPGPIRQCRRAVAGRRRDPHSAKPNSRRSGWPSEISASPPNRAAAAMAARPERRPARRRRKAGRSGDESRRNLGDSERIRHFPSWPGLSRPSTSCMKCRRFVDARDNWREREARSCPGMTGRAGTTP